MPVRFPCLSVPLCIRTYTVLKPKLFDAGAHFYQKVSSSKFRFTLTVLLATGGVFLFGFFVLRNRKQVVEKRKERDLGLDQETREESTVVVKDENSPPVQVVEEEKKVVTADERAVEKMISLCVKVAEFVDSGKLELCGQLDDLITHCEGLVTAPEYLYQGEVKKFDVLRKTKEALVRLGEKRRSSIKKLQELFFIDFTGGKIPFVEMCAGAVQNSDDGRKKWEAISNAFEIEKQIFRDIEKYRFKLSIIELSLIQKSCFLREDEMNAIRKSVGAHAKVIGLYSKYLANRSLPSPMKKKIQALGKTVMEIIKTYRPTVQERHASVLGRK